MTEDNNGPDLFDMMQEERLWPTIPEDEDIYGDWWGRDYDPFDDDREEFLCDREGDNEDL